MPKEFDFVRSTLPAGLSVIEASAGTGKTYAISHLVPRFLLDGTVSAISEILLVTFTNDAARELSERVRRVLEKLAADPLEDEPENEKGVHRLRMEFNAPEDRRKVQQALIDLDKLTVSTIHSFCQRTIQMEGTLCGAPAAMEVITNADEILEEALHDAWESQLLGDDLLSTVAAIDKWNVEDDIRFVQKMLGLEDPVPEPPIVPLQQRLQEIRQKIALFGDSLLQETTGFLEGIPEKGWCNSGKDPLVREGHLQNLRTGGECGEFSRSFYEALLWFLKLEDHLNGRQVKAEKADAKELQVVVLSGELLGLLRSLKWDWQCHCAAQLRAKVKERLHANRQITQDGLILTLRDALRRNATGPMLAERLRGRYKVALIDESQDTDPRQFEIFSRVFLEPEPSRDWQHRLVLIGDPKQAIYGFRGADVNTYLSARKMAENQQTDKGSAIYTLEKTFRSPAPLVCAVNAFFSPARAFLKQGLEFYPASSGLEEDAQLLIDAQAVLGRVEAWIVPDGENAPYQNKADRIRTITQTVASEIVRLLTCGELLFGERKRRIQPKDFGILTNTNQEAEVMAAALKARGVPAVVTSGADVMQSDEARELLAILRAMRTPRHSKVRHAALATRLIGFDHKKIQALRAGEQEEQGIIDRFALWSSVWETQGVAKAIALIEQAFSITERMAAAELGERRVTNFRQLIDLVQAASHDHSSRPEHLVRWLAQEIQRAEQTQTTDERQVQLESDEAAVQILTMHKAKGLEYHLVFCPFLWEIRSCDGIQVLSPPSGDPFPKLVNTNLEINPRFRTLLDRVQLEDRVRLAYVALTRAKVRVWFYGGNIGPKNGSHAIGASPVDWLLRKQSAQPAVDPDDLDQFSSWAIQAALPGRGSRHSEGLEDLASQITPAPSGPLIVQGPPPQADAPSMRWVNSTVPAPSSPVLEAEPYPIIPRYWVVTSFSALTREKNRHGARELLPEPDAAEVFRPEPSPDCEPLNAFAHSAGSSLIGTAIHAWLEEWGFGEIPDPVAFEKEISAHLVKFPLLAKIMTRRPEAGKGLEARAVAEMLSHLRLAQLPGLGCTIGEACSSARASEWNFHLKIERSLAPRVLAEIFAQWPDPRFPDYAAAVRLLPQNAIQGYLQGIMDRLVVHRTPESHGYGVIDWKTNQLGAVAPTPADYRQEALIACAVESHYLLQAHLYLVALRRFLARANSAKTRLAGAWLVFLRGVRAQSERGILHINPAPELLDALDDLFAK